MDFNAARRDVIGVRLFLPLVERNTFVQRNQDAQAVQAGLSILIVLHVCSRAAFNRFKVVKMVNPSGRG
jgi:hypothetical protein